MFIGVLELFKIGIGPSSSHTVGPMMAALDFRKKVMTFCRDNTNHVSDGLHVQCTLTGSLAYTGKGHASDSAVILGLHGYSPESVIKKDITALVDRLRLTSGLVLDNEMNIEFLPDKHIVFDFDCVLKEHPNGLIFKLSQNNGNALLTETYFSIGGGFIICMSEREEAQKIAQKRQKDCPFPFESANAMMTMAQQASLSIFEMKERNELSRLTQDTLDSGIEKIWLAMKACINKGLTTEGILPGGLELLRRSKTLHQQLLNSSDDTNLNEWLCVYAMAVNEENAAGHMVVTAPTNGAAGVIPSVLYYFIQHEQGSVEQVKEFLMVAAAIGGIIKHRSSISGAEVGCQGEVGSAAAMAAAGLCAVRGGSTEQIENAAEIALEHHMGMTCDPIKGLVQIPCIERNGFGAIKAYTAAALALRGTGQHFVSLDNCIAAMKQTGQEMSSKYKETSLGGLAVNYTDC